MTSSFSARIQGLRWARLFPLLALGGLILCLGTFRKIGNYGVETDFYALFVPEAQRLLAGEPLLVTWHPPFYPSSLAVLHLLVDDWFQTGVFFSALSSLVALGSVYFLFRGLFGTQVGWAAAVGLALWPRFLELSVTASADMLFLALMMFSLAAAVSGSGSSRARFLIAGFAAGLASLTRTNGLLLVLLPFLAAARVPSGRRLEAFLLSLGGLSLPWSFWLTASRLSGSPILPQRTYIDVATAFYAPEGSGNSSNSDNWKLVESEFSSLFDVVLHDPWTLFLGVMSNLVSNIWRVFEVTGILAVPMAAIAVVGLLWLLLQKRDGVRLAFWLIFLVQYAALATRSFNDRYFLFLVPVLAAGAFSLGRAILVRVDLPQARRNGVLAIVSAVTLISVFIMDYRHMRRLFRHDPVEVLAAVEILRGVSDGSEHIVARKPQISFYAGLVGDDFPMVESVGELQQRLCSGSLPDHRRFLFYGAAEARLRPGLSALQTPAEAPEWLRPVADGDSALSSWALYEIGC